MAGLAYDHLRSKRDIFTVHLAERSPAEAAEDPNSSRFAPLPPQIRLHSRVLILELGSLDSLLSAVTSSLTCDGMPVVRYKRAALLQIECVRSMRSSH